MDSRIRISDRFSTSLTNYYLLAFLVQSPADFHDIQRNNDADKVINPLHLGSDPADIRIRVRINPEIRIGIPDHF